MPANNGNYITMAHGAENTYRHLASGASRLPANAHLRELVWNGVEADATEIEIIPSKSPQKGSGAKIVVLDNGHGMSADKLMEFFTNVGKGAYDDRGNFHYGGRLSTLFWNTLGVVVATWTADNPDGAFLWLTANPITKLIQWKSSNKDKGKIGSVPKQWQFLKSPSIVKAGHGTAIMLLGNSIEEDTWGFHEAVDSTSSRLETGISHLVSGWFGTKFYDPRMSNKRINTAIRLGQGATEDRKWLPAAPTTDFPGVKRTVVPLKVLIEQELEGTRSADPFIELYGVHKLVVNGDHVADVHYIVPLAGRYAQMKYKSLHEAFGELYNGEVYGLRYQSTVNKNVKAVGFLQKYGIRDAKLQQRMLLFVEPKGDVEPTAERTHLTRNGSKLPHSAWGTAFANSMPEELFALQTFTPESPTRDQEEEQYKKYAAARAVSFAANVRGMGGRTVIGETTKGKVTGGSGAPPETSRGARNGAARSDSHSGNSTPSKRKSNVINTSGNGTPVKVTAAYVAQLEPPSVEYASQSDDNEAMFAKGGEAEGKIVHYESAGTAFVFVINDLDPWFDDITAALIKIEGKRKLSQIKKNSIRKEVVEAAKDNLLNYASDGINQIYSETGGLADDTDEEWEKACDTVFNPSTLKLMVMNTNALSLAVKAAV